MNREFLKSLELSDEQIEKIMAEYKTDIQKCFKKCRKNFNYWKKKKDSLSKEADSNYHKK